MRNGVITGAPNFVKFGNPQPLKSFSAFTCIGACGGFLDSVSLSLLNGAGGSASDTVAGFRAGIKGSDVSIPFANWVTPFAFTWKDNVPTKGGGFAFFNSIGTLNGRFGVPFANELIVGDPPDTFQLLEALDGVLGGNGILPSPIDISSDIGSDGSVNIPSADTPGMDPAPEPASIGLLFPAGASVAIFLRRRLRGLQAN
jgi:hypothetical protein